MIYNRTTNQQDGASYDANGNPEMVNGAAALWDVENRLAMTDRLGSARAGLDANTDHWV